MKKYFALSDIHGTSTTLDDFISKGFDINNSNHIIILLGDYFDRGINNREVYNWILEMRTILPNRFITLMGNHEGLIVKAYNDAIELDKKDAQSFYNLKSVDHWIRNGGDITIHDFLGLDDIDFDKLQMLYDFVLTLDMYYETESFIFTHASIDKDRKTDYWNRDMIERDNTLGKSIVIGHTPHMYLDSSITTIIQKGDGNVAIHKTIQNNVFNIDDGSHKNIVVFTEHKS